jgi:hypothetical protein
VLPSGTLSPPFAPKTLDYWCGVPPHLAEFKLACTIVDKAVHVTVNGKAPNVAVKLASGATAVQVKVVAADKKATQTYTITLYKDRIGMRPVPSDPQKAEALECPLCLTVPHRPHKANPDPIPFCSSCLTVCTRSISCSPIGRLPIARCANLGSSCSRHGTDAHRRAPAQLRALAFADGVGAGLGLELTSVSLKRCWWLF